MEKQQVTKLPSLEVMPLPNLTSSMLSKTSIDDNSNVNIYRSLKSSSLQNTLPLTLLPIEEDNKQEVKSPLITRDFGIYPIMQRITRESIEFRNNFMMYFEKLLKVVCESILKQAKCEDTMDHIYDVDTPSGVFVWKNELRKLLIKSRLELKQLDQKQTLNPLVEHFIY